MTGSLTHPDWVRRLNLFAGAVGGGDRIVSLDASEMLSIARAGAGLDDLGDDGWEPAYRAMVSAIESDAEPHLLGRLMARAEMLRVLQTRLRLVEHWNRFPEIADEPIEAPVFVIGAPRTGTSILFELLARDPGLRAPLSWETLYPLGPLRQEGREGPPSALELAECEHEFWADVHPPFATMHELASHLPAECVHFTALEFRASMYWGMCYRVPSYDAWAQGRDFAPIQYRFHRRFLQTLQHARLGRAGGFGDDRPTWLLKSPGHLANVDHILAEYPDARFVHTHRDPTKFVASVASIMAAFRFMRSDDVDQRAFGPQMALGFRYMLEHVIALRDKGTIGPGQMADVHFRHFIGDPVGAITKAYNVLGLPTSPGFDQSVLDYLRDKPKDKHGRHEYDAVALGIDESQLHQDFAAYIAHYGIELEG